MDKNKPGIKHQTKNPLGQTKIVLWQFNNEGYTCKPAGLENVSNALKFKYQLSRLKYMYRNEIVKNNDFIQDVGISLL